MRTCSSRTWFSWSTQTSPFGSRYAFGWLMDWEIDTYIVLSILFSWPWFLRSSDPFYFVTYYINWSLFLGHTVRTLNFPYGLLYIYVWIDAYIYANYICERTIKNSGQMWPCKKKIHLDRALAACYPHPLNTPLTHSHFWLSHQSLSVHRE